MECDDLTEPLDQPEYDDDQIEDEDWDRGRRDSGSGDRLGRRVSLVSTVKSPVGSYRPCKLGKSG